MPLVDQPFATTFAFARGRAADYLDAAGAPATAPVDVPRFDHDGTGAPLGLLLEGRPEFARADLLSVLDGDWNTPEGTVLHEYAVGGQIERRAWYAPINARATVNACLRVKGHHRRIAYVPVYLKNRGGFVRWRHADYALGGVVAVDAGVVLAVADNQLLLEG